jgi:hypothetical protein
MAWQVYDFFHPGGTSREMLNLAGPLPRKRWIADRKKYRVRHRIIPAYTDVRNADEKRRADEKTAEAYARWLAARDGIALPTGCKVRVEWSGVYSKFKTRNVHHWSGTKTQEAYLKRIRAVSWGKDHEVFNTRKDGRRGAWLYNEFRAELTIEIPHWDFEPAPPIEEIISEGIAA